MGRPRKYLTEEQRTKARLENNNKWRSKSMTTFSVRFHNIYDKDVLEHLKKQPNKTNYLRQLIIKDMNNSSK